MQVGFHFGKNGNKLMQCSLLAFICPRLCVLDWIDELQRYSGRLILLERGHATRMEVDGGGGVVNLEQ